MQRHSPCGFREESFPARHPERIDLLRLSGTPDKPIPTLPIPSDPKHSIAVITPSTRRVLEPGHTGVGYGPSLVSVTIMRTSANGSCSLPNCALTFGWYSLPSARRRMPNRPAIAASIRQRRPMTVPTSSQATMTATAISLSQFQFDAEVACDAISNGSGTTESGPPASLRRDLHIAAPGDLSVRCSATCGLCARVFTAHLQRCRREVGLESDRRSSSLAPGCSSTNETAHN